MTDTGPKLLRAPNHLGDVVASLPALLADGSDVMVLEAWAPLLTLARVPGEVLPLNFGWAGWWNARERIRAGGYRTGALMTPSFSSAWLFRASGIGRLRGSSTDGRAWLLTERVPAERLRGPHRIEQYRLLAGLDPRGESPPVELHLPPERSSTWRTRLGVGRRPLVGLFPGANAPARRWSVEGFGEVARRVEERGAKVVVLGGEGESAVAQSVTGHTSSGIDLSGTTDLVDLATVLSLVDVVVTNDTGPMHLAGLVHTPTVSLWGPSDPGEVRPTGADDRPVTGPALACKPCYRNTCPRTGPGTFLDDAHEECMRLILPEQVLEALDSLWPGAAS